MERTSPHAPAERSGRAVALDLDGTLVDARRRQVGVAVESLAWATGLRLPEARFWRAKRAGATTLEALMRVGVPAPAAERTARRWGERIESDDWLGDDRAVPGVRRVLGDLRRSARSVTVLTARRRADGAVRSLDAAGLSPLIDALIVVDPSEAAVAKARALGRLAPDVFVGDTESDGEAARRAGVPFKAVMTGQRSRAYLAARGYEPAGSLRIALGLGARGRSPSEHEPDRPA